MATDRQGQVAPGRIAVDLSNSRSLAPELRELLEPPKFTEEGFLQVEGFGAKADNVQVYVTADGRMDRQFRPAAEVFDDESIRSWIGSPLVVLHPEQRGDASRLLHPDNVRDHHGGTVIDARPVPEHGLVWVQLLFQSRDAIDAVQHPDPEKRLEELSAGYLRDLDRTPGVAPDGTPYDARQLNIIINHLALVAAARAGREARVALDGDAMLFTIKQNDDGKWIVLRDGERVAACDSEAAAEAKARQIATDADGGSGGPTLRELDLGGGTVVRVAADDADGLLDKLGADRAQRAEADAAAARQEANEAKKEAAEARAALDKARAEADAAKAEADKLRKRAEARALEELREEAKALLPEGAAIDGLDASALKRRVISAVWEDLELEGRAEAGIDALYDAAKKSIAADRKQVADVNGATRPGSTTGDSETDAAPDPRSARAKWLEQQQKAQIDAATA